MTELAASAYALLADGTEIEIRGLRPADAEAVQQLHRQLSPQSLRGVGTLLLEHLGSLARARGIVEFRAEILAQNCSMLRAIRDVGFDVRRECPDPHSSGRQPGPVPAQLR